MELKSCPFCGSDIILFYHTKKIWCTKGKCGAKFKFPSNLLRVDVIRRFNQRRIEL